MLLIQHPPQCIRNIYLLLLCKRYRAGRAYTHTGLASFAIISLIGIGLAVSHLKNSDRTVTHAFLATFTFVSVNCNSKCHLTSPP